MTQELSIPLPPEPIELVNKMTGALVAFACPKCGHVLAVNSSRGAPEEQSRSLAALHCHRFCGGCSELLTLSTSVFCTDCASKRYQEKEQRRLEKAKRMTIEEYPNQPVYWEGHQGSLGDGYFADIEEVLDHCEENDLEVPGYVLGCTSHSLTLRAEDILEREMEEFYEGAYDSISDAAKLELQVFLDNWTMARSITSWSEDYSVVVLLNPEASSDAQRQAN